MSTKDLIKILLLLGGILEIIIGVLFMFLDLLFEEVGLENIPIFTQMAGTFLLCYGILLIYSIRDVDKFIIIPLVNILVHIIMIVFSIINSFEYLQFYIILIIAIPYDFLWSLLLIILLKKEGLIFKKS
ncbi:MAG: hypothetical protein ACFFEY_10050 [Candidatus Thorarchaeota archaeon]